MGDIEMTQPPLIITSESTTTKTASRTVPLSIKFEKLAKGIAQQCAPRIRSWSSATMDNTQTLVMGVDHVCRFPGGKLDHIEASAFLELIARNMEVFLDPEFKSNYTFFVRNEVECKIINGMAHFGGEFSEIYIYVDKLNEFRDVPVMLVEGYIAMLHTGL